MNKIAYILLGFAILLFSFCKNDDNESSNYETEDNLIKLSDLDNDINESSGLVKVDQVLWTHNDSDGANKIYSIIEDTGEIDQKVNIDNATNSDWEDIAVDASHLYIGDFGNNSGERQDLTIYKIPKSVLPADTDAEKIFFIFSDQTSFNNSNNMHNFDCEAMIATANELFIFSKNHVDLQTKLYSLPKTPGVYTADRVDAFDVEGLITGAAMDEVTNTLCLLGYNKDGSDFLPFVWIFYDYTGTDFFNGTSKRINLPIQAQTEGICFKGNGEYIISSENEGNTEASIYLFDADKWK